MNDTIIKDEDVFWQMHWGANFKDKPPTEMIFEQEKALARLLAEEQIHINNHWWEKEWPEQAQQTTGLFVNCNDVFAWGCADGEEVSVTELQDLYEHWLKDPRWGAAIWCCKKRGELPQRPVLKEILASGIWDMESMDLKVNAYDKHLQDRAAAS